MPTITFGFKSILATFLFCACAIGHSQIDYDALVRNLEEVDVNTIPKTYLKGLAFKESNYDEDITFSDERFLRYYDVIIDKVSFKSSYSGKEMNITPAPFS